MDIHHLAYMANQIGCFYAGYPKDQAVDSIATHIRKFWDPRMRIQIQAYLAEGGELLEANVREAIGHLGAPAKAGDGALSE